MQPHPPAEPPKRRPLIERFAAGLLRVAGWRSQGDPPKSPRCVIVAAPHTSNWDLLWMLSFSRSYGLRPRFMMKHTVFVGPLDWVFRFMGGIPIDRRRAGGVVKQMAEAFAAEESLALVIPPEGTRGFREHWKSGFYRIALEADVPVILSFLDYRSRVAGFGPEFRLTGRGAADMDLIRDFYADKIGRNPERFSTILLPDESPEA